MIVRMLALVAALALTAQTPPPSISGAVYRG
ncbi:MAG: hypothetical protein QOD51_1970, partial [Candidatus Eremiobacteraeota bacterium]|nr:hypothetical protein [Candidatus Eremiobacteraeota bacterium]